jgi:hypothetical protein
MNFAIHVYHHVLFDQGDPALPVLFAELELRLMSALSDKLAALDAVVNRIEARITELEAAAANGGANTTELDQVDQSIARLERLATPGTGPTPTPMPRADDPDAHARADADADPDADAVPDPNAPTPLRLRPLRRRPRRSRTRTRRPRIAPLVSVQPDGTPPPGRVPVAPVVVNPRRPSGLVQGWIQAVGILADLAGLVTPLGGRPPQSRSSDCGPGRRREGSGRAGAHASPGRAGLAARRAAAGRATEVARAAVAYRDGLGANFARCRARSRAAR